MRWWLRNATRNFWRMSVVNRRSLKKEKKQRIEAQHAILKLQQLPYIIKFWGKSYIPELGTVLVYEWASHGALKELYEQYDLYWYDKLRTAVNICCGLPFYNSSSRYSMRQHLGKVL
ncbi:4461_t:CDS:1 [Acaulospora colombiana]|uniref:4461_t:CDS:1 n=1 Tax=Acaulospora colombiana TaxID=27376 RepID=A0ACA9K0Y4_9GLOM|nr:4461_t:CDS:1 [Acaulospora colombiana]